MITLQSSLCKIHTCDVFGMICTKHATASSSSVSFVYVAFFLKEFSLQMCCLTRLALGFPNKSPTDFWLMSATSGVPGALKIPAYDIHYFYCLLEHNFVHFVFKSLRFQLLPKQVAWVVKTDQADCKNHLTIVADSTDAHWIIESHSRGWEKLHRYLRYQVP